MCSVFLKVLAEGGAVMQQVERRLVHQLAKAAVSRLVLAETHLVGSKRAVTR